MEGARSLPEWTRAPAHNGRTIPCRATTECAISTITLKEGSFACIVLSNPHDSMGTLAVLDRAEVEAHITFLRNAIEDAERIDAGKPAIHAARSLRRN